MIFITLHLIYLVSLMNDKACVRYFLSNFYFFTKLWPFKSYNFFLFHRKSSFRSQDVQIFVIFFLPFHTFPNSKGQIKMK